ncbi:MAG: hypothetical protein CMD72_04465 [Gammaproteobacteria bacterium]|nr:hypothetical protein [Gammaproteobacteria bacterium]
MKINVKKWSFKENDHLWLEDSMSDMYIENNFCDGCGSKMIEISKVVNIKNEPGIATGLCPDCGYVKRTRNLPQEWFNSHFNNKWLVGNNDKISDQQKLVEDKYVFERLVKYIPVGGKVLDAGCGIGQRLLPFYNSGYDTYGFDPSDHRTNEASQTLPNLEINTAEKYFENKSTSYDAIFFFNVLQFVENPFEVIKKAVDNLSDGGVLFFSVGHFPKDVSNFCQFSHFGVIRSFITLFALKNHFINMDLWPLEYSQSPFEIILRKGVKGPNSEKTFNTAKRIDITDIDSFIKKTLHMNRLKIFGKSKINYQGRQILLNRSKDMSLSNKPIKFVHTEYDLPILLK